MFDIFDENKSKINTDSFSFLIFLYNEVYDFSRFTL